MIGRYLYLTPEEYKVMGAKGVVKCEEIVDEASGETRFKILVRVSAGLAGDVSVIRHLGGPGAPFLRRLGWANRIGRVSDWGHRSRWLAPIAQAVHLAVLSRDCYALACRAHPVPLFRSITTCSPA